MNWRYVNKGTFMSEACPLPMTAWLKNWLNYTYSWIFVLCADTSSLISSIFVSKISLKAIAMRPSASWHVLACQLSGVMTSLKPDFICLIEMKSNSSPAHCFCDKFSKSWGWVAIPSNGLSGEIIVLWNRIVGFVTPMAISRSGVHLIISSSVDTWIFTTVYNTQVFSKHKKLWRSLNGISILNSPWLLTRDFNAICNNEVHRGGSFRNYASKLKSFMSFILDNNLIDQALLVPGLPGVMNKRV